MKDFVNSNCSKCREYFQEPCVEESGQQCICKNCPRNFGKCIVTKWCSETESALQF